MMNRKRVVALILCMLMLLTLIPTVYAEEKEAEMQENVSTRELPDQIRQSEKPVPEKTRATDTFQDEPLTLGSNDFVISAEGETVYRPFTPTEDGYYAFYSVTDSDTYGYLLDSDKSRLTYNDDYTDNDFCIRYELEKGETYYLGVRYYSSIYTGTIPVVIERHPMRTCGENLFWSYDDSSCTLSITGTGDMWDFSYDGVPWRSVANQIRSVELPDGLTSIGRYAFWAMPQLQSIDIPNGVVSIGGESFMYTWLTGIVLPESVKSIDGFAFYDCEQMETVSLPDSLEKIGAFAFAYSAVTSLRIPKNVSDIEYAAFAHCANLQPEAFTVDPENPAFSAENGVLYWERYGLVTLHSYLHTKRNQMFTVHADRIYAYAFYTHPYIEHIILSDGMLEIDSCAFEECTALQSVTIPTSLTYISSAFYQCSSLINVYYLGTEETRNSTLSIHALNNEHLLEAAWHYGEPFDGTLVWNEGQVQYKGSTAYVIADGSAQTPQFTIKDAGGNVIPSSKYTCQYLENTNAGTAYTIVTFKDESGYAGFILKSFKIYLPATTTTMVANRNDGIYLTWSAVDGAAGYVIYRRAWSTTTGGWTDFVRWNNTTSLNWTDTNVYAGTRYQYGIKAYFIKRADAVTGAVLGGNVGDNYNLGMVGPLKTTVRITTRKLNSVTAGSKQLTAKWSGSSNFTGYQVQIATDQNFTKNVKTVTVSNPKTYQKTITGLKSNTTYYVRVRSYHIFEGVTYYGGWSNVKNCKVK